jgi:hypothetical protein
VRNLAENIFPSKPPGHLSFNSDVYIHPYYLFHPPLLSAKLSFLLTFLHHFFLSFFLLFLPNSSFSLLTLFLPFSFLHFPPFFFRPLFFLHFFLSFTSSVFSLSLLFFFSSFLPFIPFLLSFFLS